MASLYWIRYPLTVYQVNEQSARSRIKENTRMVYKSITLLQRECYHNLKHGKYESHGKGRIKT